MERILKIKSLLEVIKLRGVVSYGKKSLWKLKQELKDKNQQRFIRNIGIA